MQDFFSLFQKNLSTYCLAEFAAAAAKIIRIDFPATCAAENLPEAHAACALAPRQTALAPLRSRVELDGSVFASTVFLSKSKQVL